MSDLFAALKQKVAGKNVTIVFPEGLDERILTAVGRLAAENVLHPIVIGEQEAVVQKAKELGLNAWESRNYRSTYVRRNGGNGCRVY
ncbi:Phosphate acetyltransferase [Anoxybacillus sp. BCO1]|nr:Phosphate acetyltransferase [Anoxybacillus sp. BCO1]